MNETENQEEIPVQPNVESATAQTAPQGETAGPRNHAPIPPAGAETSCEATEPPEAAREEPKKEKKSWPKTQRGLIILVVVLALVLGFAGGVAGTLVIQATGLFQQDQQAGMDASAMGDFSGNAEGTIPDSSDGMGDMGTAPDGMGDDTELGEVPGDLGGDTTDSSASA